MPIIYDLETDIRFLQGVEQEAKKQSIQREEDNKAKIIKMLMGRRLSIAKIADYMNVPQKYVADLKNQLDNN